MDVTQASTIIKEMAIVRNGTQGALLPDASCGGRLGGSAIWVHMCKNYSSMVARKIRIDEKGSERGAGRRESGSGITRSGWERTGNVMERKSDGMKR
jgi:hypothetical protein